MFLFHIDFLTNCLVFGAGLAGRHFAVQHGSPRILWSAVAVAVPIFALMSKAKLDRQDTLLGRRKVPIQIDFRR